MTTTMPISPEHGHDPHRDMIQRLSHEARGLWRREPDVDGPARTEVMRELAAVRLDLEAVERRQQRTVLDIEDEHTLHYCASRIDALRVHWPEDRAR